MIGFILILILLYLTYYIAIKPHFFWSKKHVKTGVVVPLFGDNYRVVFGIESFSDMFQRIYNKIQNVRYLGSYQFLTPMLLIKSPDLIKRVCVKDFDHFLNHQLIVPEGADELFAKNLSALQGQTWKNMRSTLSPTFTSSKMKMMFVLMCENADSFVKFFLKKNEKIVEVDMKDALTRFTMDVIASTAFGIKTDSLEDRENEFYLMGKEASNFNSLRVKLAFFGYQLSPKLSKFLRLTITTTRVRDYFVGLVKETIKMRERENIQRPDMLGLLLDARKNQQEAESNNDVKDNSFAAVEEYLDVKKTKENLSDLDITAQAFIFFVAGFENVSTAMCFMSYELAVNTDVQTRLIEEIDDVKSKSKTLTYEALMGMEYMDMVVTELLRKWPLAVATDRVTSKPYTIQPELQDEEPLLLNPGDLLMIPIFGIHRDPKYYENPDKFDPERFSPENRKNIDPYTYLPFGAGPRNCIASRFVLLEMKTLMFHLLSRFEVVPVEKTHIPLKLKRSAINLTSEYGWHFGLRRRN